ncbi:MAG: hypothetical protein AAF403_07035, partial [Pseudomonadota bacterium]
YNTTPFDETYRHFIKDGDAKKPNGELNYQPYIDHEDTHRWQKIQKSNYINQLYDDIKRRFEGETIPLSPIPAEYQDDHESS